MTFKTLIIKLGSNSEYLTEEIECSLKVLFGKVCELVDQGMEAEGCCSIDRPANG